MGGGWAAQDRPAAAAIPAPVTPVTTGALSPATRSLPPRPLVFGRYLSVREGPAFVGTLVDAQIQSKNISDVFAKAQMVPSNLERLDIEFHRWLIDRATRHRSKMVHRAAR